MPKRAITSDKIFKGSLPFAQATVAGGFMFACLRRPRTAPGIGP